MASPSIKPGASSGEQLECPRTLLLSLQPTQPGSKKPESGLAEPNSRHCHFLKSSFMTPSCSSTSRVPFRGPAKRGSSAPSTMGALLASPHSLGRLHLLCNLQSLPKVSPVPSLLMRHSQHSPRLSCAQHGVLYHTNCPPPHKSKPAFQHQSQSRFSSSKCKVPAVYPQRQEYSLMSSHQLCRLSSEWSPQSSMAAWVLTLFVIVSVATTAVCSYPDIGPHRPQAPGKTNVMGARSTAQWVGPAPLPHMPNLTHTEGQWQLPYQGQSHTTPTFLPR